MSDIIKNERGYYELVIPIEQAIALIKGENK
jgi:hypothetical protein